MALLGGTSKTADVHDGRETADKLLAAAAGSLKERNVYLRMMR